ncbi:LOW QUALITY PROTEIN: rho GTPase-activating protein 21-like [Amphiura filiformis]|uniref:LOW QUALITY PROTEIN: rho GTPase-activating protein 21-like n=1 Tax=Amphiura filiformis TaxID=82378 RepID=UPI003B21D779
MDRRVSGIHKTDPLSNWKGPRKITLKRNASGYGFTLRHFIVYPPESAVAELTRQEGATEDDGDRKKKRTKIAALEPMDTIFVKHVKKNGPAESAGLSTGDRIVSVNGESVTGKTYSQVVALIQASGSSLRLLVVPREEDILQVAYPTSAYKFSPEKKPLDPTSSGVHSNVTRTRSESFELPSSSSSSQVSSSSPVGSLQLDDSNDTVIVGTGVERGDADFQRSSTEMILSVGTKPIKTSTPVYTSQIPRRSSDDGSDEPPKVKIIMGEPNTSPRNSATYRPIPTSPTRNSVPSSPRSITPNKDNRVVLPTAYRATYAANNTNSNAQKPHRTFKITSIFGSNNNSVRQTQNDPNIARSEASIYTSNATSGNHVNTSDSVTSSAVVNVPSRTPVLHIRSPLENNNQYNTQIGRRQSDGMTSSQIPLPKHSTSLDNIQVQERPPGSNIVIQTPNGKHASSHDNLHVTPGNMVRLQIATPSDRKLSLQGSADSQLNTSTSSETTVRRYYRSETTEQRERSTSATDRLSAVTSANKIEMQGHSTNETRRFARHTSYDGSQRVFVQGYYQPTGISSSTGSVRHDATRHSRSATVSSVSSSSSQPESDRSLSDVSGAHTTNLHVKRSAMRTEQQEYISPSGERKVLSHSQEANEMRGMELVGNKGNMAVYRSGADVRSSQVTDSRGRVSSSGSVKQMQDGRVHDIMQMPSGEVRIIPKGPQGSIEYWDKKPITESGEQPKGIDESDSWLWQKRNSGQFVDVRNPQLSKSRIRERSLERDKRRERQMHERHRSRSYDRSHQRTQGWVRQQVNVRQHHQEGDNISLDRSQRGRSLSSSRERERSDSVASEDSFDDFEPDFGIALERGRRAQSEHARMPSSGIPTLVPGVHQVVYRRLRSFDEDIGIGSLQDVVSDSMPHETPTHKTNYGGTSLKAQVDNTRASRKFHIYGDFKLDGSKLRRSNSKESNSSTGSKKERRREWLYSEPKVEMRRYTSPSPKRGLGEDSTAKLRRDRRNMHVYDDSQYGIPIARRATSPDTSIQELEDFFPTMHVYDMEPYNLEVATRQRLVRRTSYLRATASEENGTTRDKKSTENEAPSITASKENVDEAGNKSTPPKRSTSIRKLKNFFGEGTPRIVEASTQDTANVPTSSHVTTLLPHESDVVKEGPANVKVELKDGKRAYDRSWKPVWISLRGHIMYFKKERREQGVVVSDHPTTAYSSVEEHPLSIKAAMVDIAYDYTKKRNVFRLCTFSGSEYLIQVSDTQTMLAWISAIQTNNNPDDDVEGVVTQELILKSIYKHTHNDPPPSGAGKNNPVSPGTGRKKFMRGTSPAVPKKSSVKDDSIKGKSKAFAGMMKTSMKWKGGVPQPNEEITPTHAFCVPLETCVPSTNNEFVPMLVDICCDIVHEKGLTVVGIYRIPGNTAGVTYLQEELNKGVEQVNLEDERWNEVNVVGSLLKLFFRKLPNPLVPKDQYSLFIRANRCDDPAERMWALRRQIHDLPDHHYETFKHLANHLKDVASNSDINKMEVRNLAIVFGPTLIRAADDSMVTMVTDMSDQCRIVESIIQHCDWFFNDDVESQQDVPSDAMPESDVMPDANCLLATAKEDDKSGESGSDSAKNKDIAIDIVSSVLSAANRKLKGRSVKRAPLTSEDGDSDNFGFGERGTDSNSKVRALRLQNQDVEKPVVKEDEDDEVVLPSVTITLRRDSQSSIPSTITESEVGTAYSSDLIISSRANVWFCQTTTNATSRSHYRQGNTRDRKFSDSSITSDTSSQFSLPYGTSQLLESQTQRGSRKGIFISDGDWKSEFARERERIEREHAIAVQDYETEDHTNIEELYKSKDYLKAISSVSTKIADFASQEDNESKDAPELRPLPDSTSITSDYSTTSSSNNNNTLQEARSNASSSSPRQLSSREQSELMNSPTPLEELENESDFVQSMKATFDERLEKVLRQESEDDLSLDTHLQNNLERKLDEMKSNSDVPHHRKNVNLRELEQSMENSELRTPSKDATPFDLSLLTASLKSPSLDTKSFGSPDNMSPMRSPRKVSRIEVILTLEKRDKTPVSTPEVENIDPMTVEGSKVLKKRNKTPSKDTLSLKQKHRENRRRRHTVAGSGKGIPEHNQLMEYYFGSVNPDESSVKKSAFDRLKPFGKEVKGPELRDMTSWLKSERVRNSNSFPNLASSSVSSLNESNAKAERPSSIPLFDDKRSLHVQKSPPPKEPRPQVLSREPRYYEIESYI